MNDENDGWMRDFLKKKGSARSEMKPMKVKRRWSKFEGEKKVQKFGKKTQGNEEKEKIKLVQGRDQQKRK